MLLIFESPSIREHDSPFAGRAHLPILWKERYLQHPWSWFSQMCWSRRCSVCEEISLLGPLRKNRKRWWMGAGGGDQSGFVPLQSFKCTLGCWITLTWFLCLIYPLNYNGISTDRFKVVNLTWLEARGNKNAGEDQYPHIYHCFWDANQKRQNSSFFI